MKFRYNLVIVCLTLAIINLVQGNIKTAMGNIVGIPIVMALAKLLGILLEKKKRKSA
jgi:hypothetical protein